MKKRIVTITLTTLAIVLVGVGFIIYGVLNDSRLTAARSITLIDEGLYTMTYRGDYGFDAFLAQGGASTDAAMGQYVANYLMQGFGATSAPDTTAEMGCSTFIVRNERNVMMGRNFDFPQAGKVMIVKSQPDSGYSSVSTACLDFMGMPAEWQPDGDIPSRMAALTALYLPLDGINEMGLMVADLVNGDEEETHQCTDKPDITTTTAIRLLLDKASTVDEAVELLKQYDMNTSIGTSHHIAIADASGRSVVAEYIEGELVVTPTDIVTNHYLAPGPKCGVGNELSHERFTTIAHLCSILPIETSPQRVMEILQQASYPQFTQWSVVFDADLCEARYVWKSGFEKEPFVISVFN